MSNNPGLSPKGEPSTFEGCLLRVNPSIASLEQLSAQVDDSPILMLNFLRFRPRGDSTIYSLYAKEAAPEVKKVGSFIGYYGKTITDFDPKFGFDDSWDGIVLPVYHRRDSYLTMQNSNKYQLSIPYRSAGTSRRTLYPLADGDKIYQDTYSIKGLDEQLTGIDIQQGEIYIADLLRFNKSKGKAAFKAYAAAVLPLLAAVDAKPVLSVNPEQPVLSEELWDHFILTRFPSRQAVNDLYQNEAWIAAQDIKNKTLENCISIASEAIVVPQ